MAVALGPSVSAVIVFEILSNASAVSNHANVALPKGLDRAIRLFIATPDMHRIHHSVRCSEHDTNYGFNLSVWDRLFGTNTVEPLDDHLGMKIGLPDYQTAKPTHFGVVAGAAVQVAPPPQTTTRQSACIARQWISLCENPTMIEL